MLFPLPFPTLSTTPQSHCSSRFNSSSNTSCTFSSRRTKLRDNQNSCSIFRGGASALTFCTFFKKFDLSLSRTRMRWSFQLPSKDFRSTNCSTQNFLMKSNKLMSGRRESSKTSFGKETTDRCGPLKQQQQHGTGYERLDLEKLKPNRSSVLLRVSGAAEAFQLKPYNSQNFDCCFFETLQLFFSFSGNFKLIIEKLLKFWHSKTSQQSNFWT